MNLLPILKKLNIREGILDNFHMSKFNNHSSKPGRNFGSRCLALGAGLLALGATSCNMVNEDMPECPHTFIVVDFEYKYHMSSEYLTTEDDWFGDHAGSVYLYVFDQDSTYLFSRQKNKAYLDYQHPDFSIWMDETECEPGKKYIFAAMAQGNHAGYLESLKTPGFTLLTEMIPGKSKLSDYRVKLDRDGDGYYDFGVVTDDYGVFDYKSDYKNNNLKLDTLWSTRPGFIRSLDVPERDFSYRTAKNTLRDDTVSLTIPMMRITNSIKVNLVCDDFDQDTNVDDYKFLIDFPNGNGTLGFSGNLDKELSQELMYFTLRKNVKQYQYKNQNAQYDSESENNVVADSMHPSSGGNSQELGESSSQYYSGFVNTRAATYCVAAEFGVSRLQQSDGSFLQIINAGTGREIARIDNLSDWLAEYFDHRYDDQEFLDREYDWAIDIHIDNDGNPIMLQAGCYILGWGKRIQDVVLQ